MGSGLSCGTKNIKIGYFEPRTISGSALFSSMRIFRHGSLSERFSGLSRLLELAKNKTNDKHFDKNGPGIPLKQETMHKAIIQTGSYYSTAVHLKSFMCSRFGCVLPVVTC
jgi:hypothetical protein